MSEQNATEGQQSEEQGQQPAHEATESPQLSTSAGNPESPLADQSAEIARLMNVVREREKENKKYRDREKQREKQDQERADAEKTEIEKLGDANNSLAEENTTLKQRMRRFYFNEQINLPNSRWAWAAAQDAGIEVDFDDEQRPTNLDSVRKELKKLDPNLFGTTQKVDAGDTGAAEVKEQTQATFLSDLLFNQNR